MFPLLTLELYVCTTTSGFIIRVLRIEVTKSREFLQLLSGEKQFYSFLKNKGK